MVAILKGRFPNLKAMETIDIAIRLLATTRG
jgi:hypothetical protein